MFAVCSFLFNFYIKAKMETILKQVMESYIVLPRDYRRSGQLKPEIVAIDPCHVIMVKMLW